MGYRKKNKLDTGTITMEQVAIPNSAFIGNIENFIREIDTENPKSLNITFNKHWISIHPVALILLLL